MSWEVRQGDALALLQKIPAESVDCVVTSPPYWGLRDYRVAGQIGLEATLEVYVETLAILFDAVNRVLVRTGTCWINIGDSYNAYNGGAGPASKLSRIQSEQRPEVRSGFGLRNKARKPKDMLLAPWRLLIALQERGWYVRDVIVWDKPAPMPESVTDRCTKSWEPILMLTKSTKYFFDAAQLREPADPNNGRDSTTARRDVPPGSQTDSGFLKGRRFETRQKRNVWRLRSMPSKDAHFATFPLELPETCILGGCPPGGLVLDPFSGSGTTGLAALKHGRQYLGLELNPEYIEISRRRLLRHYPLLAAAAQ